MRTFTNAPINLDVLNEFSEIHHSASTQETTGRSPAPSTQIASSQSATRGSDIEPTRTETEAAHNRASAPGQPGAERGTGPALAPNQSNPSLSNGIAADQPTFAEESSAFDSTTAPSAEGRRIMLPPPIPGFIAGAADAGK